MTQSRLASTLAAFLLTGLAPRGMRYSRGGWCNSSAMFALISRISVYRTVLCGSTLLVTLSIVSCVPHAPPTAGEQPHSASVGPSDASRETRQRFLEMFARTYFPGRTGQLAIVPREGDFITRPDPDVTFMHGSPWPYDVFIPLMFVGPAVKTGEYSMPAAQQDVAPTLAAALGTRMPPTATGHVLPILQSDFVPPRVVMLLVLDGMRRDYFDRYAASMPTLTALRGRAAWFSQASVNFFPTNTSEGHSTLATGADPRVHGITGNNIYDRVQRRRHDMFEGGDPADLVAMTLADVWQLETAGRAVVIAQGSVERAAIPLAGHGSCQPRGSPVILASYNPQSGDWNANSACFRLPVYLKEQNARTVWPQNGQWLGHKIDSAAAVRYSALFPRFEADAMTTMIEREPLGKDDVADLILMNFKGADYVGHRYGPDSNELRVTLGEMDREISRMLRALEDKVGRNYLLAVTADHGMPSEPPSPDRRHFAPSLVDLLHERFDPEGRRLVTLYEPENSQIFVDTDRVTELGLTLHDLARFLESQPFVFAVFTEDEVRSAAQTTK